MRQKLKQKLLHEFGLQLKHVVIKSAVGISMPIDFKKKRPFGSRKLPLCVTQQLKENMRRLVEIFVGQNSVGDGYRAGGMVHVFSVVTIRRESAEWQFFHFTDNRKEGDCRQSRPPVLFHAPISSAAEGLRCGGQACPVFRPLPGKLHQLSSVVGPGGSWGVVGGSGGRVASGEDCAGTWPATLPLSRLTGMMIIVLAPLESAHTTGLNGSRSDSLWNPYTPSISIMVIFLIFVMGTWAITETPPVLVFSMTMFGGFWSGRIPISCSSFRRRGRTWGLKTSRIMRTRSEFLATFRTRFPSPFPLGCTSYNSGQVKYLDLCASVFH